MLETHFLSVVQAFLESLALAPALKAIGVAEPIAAEGLPALVLSLEASRRPASGLGERSTVIQGGALPWQATIDLENPFLPDDDSFSLLSDDRRVLVVPHGGLVQKSGAEGALGADDFTLKVAGTLRPLVAGTPSGLECSVDPAVGRVTFGTPLPATGKLEVSYVLGQWERRVAQLAGVLRVDVCAAAGGAAGSLGDAVLDALTGDAAGQAIERLVSLDLASLGSVGGIEVTFGNCRRRTARFSFEYEQNIDRPDSSGGIIRQIPVRAQL